MKIVSFSLEAGNKYYGVIDGQRFYIGNRVSYEGGKGLMNTAGRTDQRYDRKLFRSQFGFWADFIHPTAIAEGALYHTLNTYDRARFTFSFLQFAAHVPNGDFVIYFRKLLAQPLAAEYFPDLVLHQERICKFTDGVPLPLETDSSTMALMNYLNPSLTQVEDTEVIQSAKFIHWAQSDQAHQLIQISVGVEYAKVKMADYARSYQLDGVRDVICLVVADIRHQGRAKNPEIITALRTKKPLEALLEIGESLYRERIAVLRREIKALVADGTFGNRTYSMSNRDFVVS